MSPQKILKYLVLTAFALSCTWDAATAIAQTAIGEINPPASPDVENRIALIGGRLIDGTGAAPVEDAVVLIKGDSIVAAGNADSVTIDKSFRLVQLAGQTILPGFVDCHFHSINDLNPPATFLSHGVTSLRDPGHPFRFYETVLQTQEMMPRVFLCGGHIDATPPIWPDQASVADSPGDGARIVREHRRNGATAIKVYFRLPLETIKAVCEEADQQEIPVTAHLELVTAADAIRAGVDGIEHATSFGTSLCTSAEKIADFVETISRDPKSRHELRYRLWAEIDFEDNPKLSQLLRLLKENDVFVSPTLAIHERRASMEDASQVEVAGFQQMLEFIGRCHEAGITIVAGSHTWVPGAKFGWAFQREMELLVESGMTPLEAISAATREGSRFLGVDEQVGTIEVGKLADLVIVSGTPEQDISHTRRVERVMLNGKWLAARE